MSLLSSNESQQPTGHRTAFSAFDVPATEELHQLGNHRWRPSADVSLSLEDIGSLQGATLVERLRTVGGQPLDVDEHLARLMNSADEIGIQWPRYLTADLVRQCAHQNRPVHSAPDFGIVVLLTPGSIRSQPLGSAPTVIVHSVDLHWPQLAHWYQFGQPLVIASNCNVPEKCSVSTHKDSQPHALFSGRPPSQCQRSATCRRRYVVGRRLCDRIVDGKLAVDQWPAVDFAADRVRLAWAQPTTNHTFGREVWHWGAV